MKKFFIYFFLFTLSVNAQWEEQRSNEFEFYSSMFFLDSLYGWTTGYTYPGNPFILRTTDGGESWSKSSITGSPRDIFFITKNIGFCTTFNGIYKTIDGGENWSSNYTDEIHYCSIKFIDENIGWAAGSDYKNLYFLKTSNGGINWTRTFVAKGSEPKIEIIDSSKGFFISESLNEIRKTTNGGADWQIVFADSNSGNQLLNIYFANDLIGYATGRKFYSTTDGGETWQSNKLPFTFTEHVFAKDNQCWVSGRGLGYTGLLYSDDYGNSWTPILVKDSSAIQDIFFSDFKKGWVCSTAGSIYPPPNYNDPIIYKGAIFKLDKNWTNDITEPTKPLQISPANESSVDEFVNFEWDKLEYCFYRLQISLDSSFTNYFVMGDSTFIGNNIYIENKPLIVLQSNRKYYWRIRAENKMGISDWSKTWSFTTQSLTDVKDHIHLKDFKLYQNYPNPFNPTTTIAYNIPMSSDVELKIFDILGNEIRSFSFSSQPAGKQQIVWNGRNNFNESVSSGIYIYKFTATSLEGGKETFQKSSKLILMK